MPEYGKTWIRPLSTVQGKKPVTDTMTAMYSYDVATGDLTVSINDPANRTKQSQLPPSGTVVSAKSISREKSFTLRFEDSTIVLEDDPLPKQTSGPEKGGFYFEASNADKTKIVRGWFLPLMSGEPETLYAVGKIESPMDDKEPKPVLVARPAGAELSSAPPAPNCIDAVVIVIPPPLYP
jgi:hypothetical protein